MLYVTLKELRDKQACISGYNRLVSSLRNTEYKGLSSYSRFRSEAPISLSYILESNGIEDALWVVDSFGLDPGPFARACALDVAHLWECPSIVREFLETGKEEIREAARVAAKDSTARGATGTSKWAAAWAAAWAAWDEEDAARAAAWDAAEADARAAASVIAWDAAREKQKQHFIKMFCSSH